MTEQPPLLTVRDLRLAFAAKDGWNSILHGVDLSIAHGEAFALVGESGSGKSVTAQAIAQLLPASSCLTKGEIWFDGEALHSKTAQQMLSIRGKKMGMIFQDPMTSLNPTLRVGWQISEALVYHEGLSYANARRRAIELLERVGIADPTIRCDQYPFQLSGGMRQRVMIAMALACRPLLLIADEPTTALDVTIQAQILDLLRQARQETGMSLLLITHDLAIVAQVCDRVAVMQKGVIVEMEKVDKLLLHPQHPYTKSLLAARQGIHDYAC